MPRLYTSLRKGFTALNSLLGFSPLCSRIRCNRLLRRII